MEEIRKNDVDELIKRKTPRLRSFDYGNCGAYFLTVCTEKREHILSTVEKEDSDPTLTKYGKIVDRFIQEIPQRYPYISVDCYVIMPNHIHLLLFLPSNDANESLRETVDRVVGWLKYQATKEINLARGTGGKRVFQRSFFDHIVRNQKDYEETHNYIRYNPFRWYHKYLSKEI